MTTETDASRGAESKLGLFSRRVFISILSIVLSLVIGGAIIALSGGDPIDGYLGLWRGAFGKEKAVVETIVKTTPFIFAGLAVAVGFRGGLFNIGVEGQLFVGSICALIAGYAVELPPGIHAAFALLMGALGGAVWAAIPGYLKARTGAHEVITTIMTNYIALRVINWSISQNGPLRLPGSALPETRRVLDSARLPSLTDTTPPLHIGVVIVIVAVFFVYWLLWRTPLGFEIRTVGLNPSAARYAGIKVERTIVLTMVISGALAGLGGAVQVLGLLGYFTTGFNVGLGFDSIAVAMLGSNHPFGVAAGALLFGVMDAGMKTMQLRTQVPRDIVVIIQGLILLFVAAPLLIQPLFRLRQVGEGEQVSISATWGGEG
ncbi:MAG: ABC transporter permease [Anaerolineae bacterium]|nr:ABC transporter permease [Anaerolineae bacterium]